MSESTAELQAGQVFAGWQVERELARGGMGVLYLARHPRLPRTDVIKVLPPWLSDNERFRSRFLSEATRMSTLPHPHVMPIHDSGESEDGTLYLVMPYIAGGDLRGLLRRTGPLPAARAARLTGQLGAALDAAHRIGVVHRDVKPENVLLASVEPDDSDHVLLTDFGISREEMGPTNLTATGELLLTPAYAAPEQVLGQTVDARADQYALGCILYELLAGRPPYLNDVQVVMLMSHVQDPVPQLARRLGLPPAIDGVLARALAKSPADRYDNCRSLAQAAHAALELTVSTPRRALDLRGNRVTPPPPVAPPSPVNAFTPAFPPLPNISPPHHGRRRRVAIVALLAIALAGVAAAVVAVVAGTGSSKPSAAYESLLARVPTGVRTTCQDTTGQLAAPDKPYVATRATCTKTLDGRTLNIAYRTVKGDADTIRSYRATVLQLGGQFNSPGNCMTFQTSAPSQPPGTKGFAQDVATPQVSGAVWCDKDGTLSYLQSSAAAGHLLILTQVHTSAGGAQAQAGQRFSDLASVAPTA